MSTVLDRVDALQKELFALRPIDGEKQQKIDKKFRLEFNYNSNHMEGNTLTYGETELLLIFEDTKGNHSIREYDEMRNHDVAFKLVEEWAKDKEHILTEQNIKNLNEVILVKPFWKEAITPDGQPTRKLITIGNYKGTPNSVRLQNGEIFHYTSPIDTPIEMAELMEWYRTEGTRLHPVILATLIHYKFVRIHPFDDGNGRVARLLMNYVLLRYGFPPVIIKSDDKGNYLRTLRSADVGDLEPMITYVAQQLMWSQHIVIKGARGESIDEQEDVDKRLKLLKNRLDKTGDLEVRVTRNKHSIIDAWNGQILPLIEKIETGLAMLSPMFKATKIRIYSFPMIGNPVVPDDTKRISGYLETCTTEVNALNIHYTFSDLRTSLDFSIDIQLSITFSTNVYDFWPIGISNKISKRYDDTFSRSEVDGVVASIKDSIIKKIETHLDGSKS